MIVRDFLLAFLLTVAPLISFASEYFVATTDLNVRAGAGKGYLVSFTLQKGDEVEVLLKQGSWYKVKYGERTGYAHSKYLKYSGTADDTEVIIDDRFVNDLLIIAYVGLVVFLCVIVYVKMRERALLNSVTDNSRGTKSERALVLKLLKCGVPHHRIFHDLYVEKRRSEFSQTDLVVVSKVGIIVFEVKDYSGWLFGSGNQSQWTQVLAYGKKKHYFYNPIMQNNSHIAELRRQLAQFENIPFYSVIVFYGNCEFKNITFVPYGTFIVKSRRVLEVVRNILRDNESCVYENEYEVNRVLRKAVENGSIVENRIRHNENIRGMLGTHRVFD